MRLQKNAVPLPQILANTMRVASLILVLFSTLFTSRIHSQTTSNCFEVESILIASCAPGIDEGKNEMVRFLVGPNQLNVNQLTVDWATVTLNFTGWAMNATTATRTAQINATIQSCGYLVEPLNGIIPANKKGIMITSYNMIPTANSFAGLTDTLYVLYQNANISTGHFANVGTGLRTFQIIYPGCITESVTYDRAMLSGNPGDYANFTQAGVASYGNDGCTAPISPFMVEAGNNPAAVCPGGTVNLSGSITGSASYQQWSGGTGAFSTPGNTSTNYTLNANQTSSFWLYFSAKGICADTLVDSVLITIQQQNPLQILASGPLNICPGDNLTLTASGGGASYQWVGGPATSQYTITLPGTYTVQSADACYNYQQSVTVNPASTPTISINPNNTSICAGATLNATATISSGNVIWSTGATGTSVNINSPGQYVASVTNGCGTASDTLVVTANPAPSAQITTQGPVNICSGNDIQLNGNGLGALTWSNGTTGNTTTVNQSGTYYLIAQNICGIDSASILVNASNINASFTADPTSGFAPLAVNMTNQSTGADAYFWDFGNGDTSTDQSPDYTFTTPGTYEVQLIVTNAQGCTDSVSIQIIVANQMTVELPNIFTPNGDQVNDEYMIKAIGVASLKADIYNRWGEKMFSWNDPTIAWNGKSVFGVMASSGVYFCVVEATDAMGNKQTFKTTVTLNQ